MDFEELEAAIFLIIGVCGFFMGLSALEAKSTADLYVRAGFGGACVVFSGSYIFCKILKSLKEGKSGRDSMRIRSER